MVIYLSWQRERRLDRDLRRQEQADQRQREQEEIERRAQEKQAEKDTEDYERYVAKKEREEERVRAEAGAGSGGYIVVDLPDSQRGLFHDLLKGFEEYAKLKGYGVSFSVDNTFHDRIAFKFTLTDPDVVVGNDRVRKDLREYIERVSRGDSLDDLPQVISIEEHEVLVATLRNRISFLQHNYNLAKNSAEFYENLMRRASSQPLLSAPGVIVQTGGSYSAPSYTALGSPQTVQGIENSSRNTLKIAVTYRERKEQIGQVLTVLEMLKRESSNAERDEAIRNLENVQEELEHTDQPEPARLTRWLERAKQAAQLGSLGHETTQAMKELLKLFGVS